MNDKTKTGPEGEAGDGIHVEMPEFQGDAPKSATGPEGEGGDGIHVAMPEFQGDAPKSAIGPEGEGGDGIHMEMPDFQGDTPRSAAGPEGEGGDGIHVEMPDFQGDAPKSAIGPEGEGGNGIQVAMPDFQGDASQNATGTGPSGNNLNIENNELNHESLTPGGAQLGGEENGWGLQEGQQAQTMEGFDEDEMAPKPGAQAMEGFDEDEMAPKPGAQAMEGFDEDEINPQLGSEQLGGDENGWGIQGGNTAQSMEGFDEDEIAPFPQDALSSGQDTFSQEGPQDSLITDGRGTMVHEGAQMEGQLQGDMMDMDDSIATAMDQSLANQAPNMSQVQQQPNDIDVEGIEAVPHDIEVDLV